MSGSSEKAVGKSIKYGTVISTESVRDGNALDQAGGFEILEMSASQGSEGYSTPLFCSSDTYLTTSI